MVLCDFCKSPPPAGGDEPEACVMELRSTNAMRPLRRKAVHLCGDCQVKLWQHATDAVQQAPAPAAK